MSVLPDEPWDVSEHGLQILVGPIQVISVHCLWRSSNTVHKHARYGSAFLIFSVYVPELTKDVFRELLIGGLFRFELVSPPKSRDEHALGLCHTQVPDDAPPRMSAW
jgi:hypothetical protein